MIEVQELDKRATLARAETTLATQLQLDADQLALAAHWADLHHPDSLPPATTAFEEGRRRLDGDHPVQPGGQGTPPILASCPAELGLVLQTSPGGAKHLIADALDLRHRLPHLWADVQRGRIRGWKARKVAQATRHLPYAVMADVDASLAGLLSSLPWSRFEAVLEATVQRADPVGAAHAEAEAASRRFVGLSRERAHGLLTLIARGEILDILTFLAAVNRIADVLGTDGDQDTLEVRRSKAVGILGQPDRALALLTAHADDPDTPPAPDSDADQHAWRRPAQRTTPPAEPDGDESVDLDTTPAQPEAAPFAEHELQTAEPEPDPGEPGTRSLTLDETTAHSGPTASIRVQLYVHLTDAALRGTDPTAVARIEGHGPVTATTVRRWLGIRDAKITVRPVAVPGHAVPVDGYEIPRSVREAVLLRSPASAYPWSWCTERISLQLDHVQPYRHPDRGGPPGQTDPDNLAPLLGPEHQRKTNRRWQERSPAPGVHLWRSPHGWITLVTNQGTFPLGTSPTAHSIWRASAPEQGAERKPDQKVIAA